MKRGLFLAAVMAAATMPGTMFAQGLDPASLTKPATDSWRESLNCIRKFAKSAQKPAKNVQKLAKL